jgi:transcriptional regulator GlxA family with amidase domain
MRDLSTDELARHVNLSTSRLRHLFRSETGQSISQYRKMLRIQKAKELIETTFLSMKQVMLKAGIKDKGQFAREFRKVYGTRPIDYRRHLTDSQPKVATISTK